MKKLNTLTDGLLSELSDLYSVESQIIKVLPKLEKKATNQRLKDAFHAHRIETESHILRLEEISTIMEARLTGFTCKAMLGLIAEGKEVLEMESENTALIDSLLIGTAQRIEHYEMAVYGIARAMAQEIELTDVAELLEKTLDEERDTNKKLASISTWEVLPEANIDQADEETILPKKKPTLHTLIPKGVTRARGIGLVGILLLCSHIASAAFAESKADAETNEIAATEYKGNTTGTNSKDRNLSRKTADDQKLEGIELDIVARLRKEIIDNTSLTTNAHNIKIVVDNRKVTLRGPVGSVAEKTWIENATTRVASGYSIDNQLTVVPG